ALALLYPHCAVDAAAPAQATTALCGRQPPCQWAATPATGVVAPAGGKAGRGRQPLVGWPLAGFYPCGWLPVAGSQAIADRPCRGSGRGQPPLHVDNMHVVALAGGLAIAIHLCMQTPCMWSPLPCRQRLLSLPIVTTSAEIVYPCIPDPDGEDERCQASSSLAISTRWISAAKLFQYDLITLAQREGGE
ncbi:hypothetical protein BHE74_00049948, partial [Ensete ventricosum]